MISLPARLLPLPLPAQRAMQSLGVQLSLARRRRGLSQASLAERMGASVSTVRRMEAGEPRIPLHFIARALHVFGEVARLATLLETATDDLGLGLMDAALPQRIRGRKAASTDVGMGTGKAQSRAHAEAGAL